MSRAVQPGRRRLAAVCACLFLWAACDIESVDAGSGCIRISQGDYELPEARVVSSSMAVRVTQAGADLVTERIEELILLFFEADEQGRAIVELSSFGVGTLSLDVGPLSGELRDLAIAFDLSTLRVDLVEGSTPARMRIEVDSTEVGLVSGQFAGALDFFFVEPDLACALGDGDAGHVAILGFGFDLILATDGAGGLDVGVDNVTVAVEDVGLTVLTDCNLPECQDGCGECQIVCSAADLAAGLAPLVQDIFAGLIDTLAAWVSDQVADVLLDAILNDKPLAVEGTLDIAALGAALLPWLGTAQPIGVLGRPAGNAFSVTGAGAGLGLELALDAGLDASPTHACIGDPGPEPLLLAGPQPPWPQLVATEDGLGRPYHFGLALSSAIVDAGMRAAWKSGALCIDVDTLDLAGLTSGQVTLTAAALEVLLPGISTVARPDAPVRFRIRPRLGTAPIIRFDDPLTHAPIAFTLDDAEVSIDALVGDHFLALVSFSADLRVGIGLDPLPGARLGVRLDGLDLSDLRVPTNEIFADARLDLVAPFVLDLVLGVLADQVIALDLDLGALVTDLVGLPLIPVIEAVEAEGDWLRILISLTDLPTPLPALAPGDLRVTGLAPGRATLQVDAPPGLELQLRAVGGVWSRWRPAAGRHELVHPRLWMVGATALEARLRHSGGLPGPARSVPVLLPAPAPPRSVEAPLLAPAAPEGAATPPTPAGALGGCSGGGPPLQPALMLLLLLLGACGLRRRRALAATAVALAALLTGACVGDQAAAQRTCEFHDQCPDDTLCGLEGVCVIATPCEADAGCCPGSLCFNGWCRPTTECAPDRPCPALGQVCEDALCVPAPCTVDDACLAGQRCVAGRCVAGLPCGGCPDDAACHLETGRCLSATLCTTPCAPGELRLVAPTSSLNSLACGPLDVDCACAALPDVPPGLPGFEGRLLSTPGGPTLISHDPLYGDLVVSRFDDRLDARHDTAIDGIPLLPAAAPPDGYRGGVLQPGPDRGRHPAPRWEVDAGQVVVELLHRDEDLGRLRYTRFDAETGQIRTSHALPVDGDAGRYSCLTRDPATGGLVGWTFVSRDPTGTNARLVRVAALVDPPTGPSDWTQELVLQSTLPLTEPQPCGGECALTQLCLRFGPGDDRCAGALELQSCDPPCGPHAVCLDAASHQCLPRVRPELDVDGLPYGAGLFVDCAPVPDGLVAAWYDRDAGAVMTVRGGGAPQVVDGTSAPHDLPDVGRHLRLAVGSAGQIALAYQDATGEALRVARQASAGAPWVIEQVHAPGELGAGLDPGAWPALIFGTNGEPIVAYGDPSRGDIWLAQRDGQGEGCWHRERVLEQGGFAWPGIALSFKGGIHLTALAFGFDDAGAPLHGVAALALPLPTGTCASGGDAP